MKRKQFSIKRIRYFSPAGDDRLPNGPGIHKGGFIKECMINSNAFEITDDVNDFSDISGFMVFPHRPGVNKTDVKEFTTWIDHLSKPEKRMCRKIKNPDRSFTIGNFFMGVYQYGEDNIFDKDSNCIKMYNLSSRGIFSLANQAASELKHNVLIIKVLKTGNIFLMKRK